MAETIEIYFLTGLQAQNLRSRFWQSSVSGEDSLFGFYVASFSPSSHTSLVSLLLRTLILSDQGPTLTASFNLKYFCEGAVCNCSHTGVSAPRPEVSGDTRIQSRTGNLLKKKIQSLLPAFSFLTHFSTHTSVSWDHIQNQLLMLNLCLRKLMPLELLSAIDPRVLVSECQVPVCSLGHS